MEVVSHRLVTELTKAGMGIGVVTYQYVKEELDKTLYKVDVDVELPKRKLGYTLMKNSVPSYRVKAFIITHYHNDVIGALPYVLQDINAPVYCTTRTKFYIEGLFIFLGISNSKALPYSLFLI